MSEENSNFDDENTTQWTVPPPPEDLIPEEEPPQMSLIQTLTNIFFEPANVFEDLRRKPFPRLLFPLILCALLISAFNISLQLKIGKEAIVREQLSMKIMDQVPEDAKKKMIEDSKQPFGIREILNSSIGFVAFFVVFAIIGLVYWGAAMAFGGSGNYWHALAVTIYSSFPPILISMIGSLIVLCFKPAEEISFIHSQNGLLKLNPTLFLDTSPVISAVLGRFDLLVLWGMFLAAVGLQKCFNISSSSGWTISIIIWLIGTVFAVLGGLFIG